MHSVYNSNKRINNKYTKHNKLPSDSVASLKRGFAYSTAPEATQGRQNEENDCE